MRSRKLHLCPAYDVFSSRSYVYVDPRIHVKADIYFGLESLDAMALHDLPPMVGSQNLGDVK